jgi:hypothetical protein
MYRFLKMVFVTLMYLLKMIKLSAVENDKRKPASNIQKGLYKVNISAARPIEFNELYFLYKISEPKRSVNITNALITDIGKPIKKP